MFYALVNLISSIFFQAILFYIPRWLWKNWEAGKIAALMMDLDLGIISEVRRG
jgi:membrane protein YdbS with pleckstrin-like domain